MPDRNNQDRARLGEQTSRRNNESVESVESEEMSASPNQVENEEDLTAGDEGIEDLSSMRTRERNDRSTTERSTIDRSSRDSGTSRREKAEDVGEFSGRGGQKGGSAREKREGTGYTNDRSGQLQEDDSLSGSQGRHGTTGNRQGSKRGRSGTSESERVGGQTAQNPRGKDRDDIDRSNM